MHEQWCRHYPPKHGLDKVVQHGLFLQLFFPYLGTYHSACTLHQYSGARDIDSPQFFDECSVGL